MDGRILILPSIDILKSLGGEINVVSGRYEPADWLTEQFSVPSADFIPALRTAAMSGRHTATEKTYVNALL